MSDVVLEAAEVVVGFLATTAFGDGETCIVLTESVDSNCTVTLLQNQKRHPIQIQSDSNVTGVISTQMIFAQTDAPFACDPANAASRFIVESSAEILASCDYPETDGGRISDPLDVSASPTTVYINQIAPSTANATVTIYFQTVLPTTTASSTTTFAASSTTSDISTVTPAPTNSTGGCACNCSCQNRLRRKRGL